MSRTATRYRSDGAGRDGYVNEDVRQPTKIHDLRQRRDTLPDNVYKYLKEQVQREEYTEYVRGLRMLDCAVATAGGRKSVSRETAQIREEALMQNMQQKFLRQQKLKELYESEWKQWEEELHARGLAIERNRD
ncbi:hypothetical protein DIPPA_04038 [Diplonema papillatum]|nr:hypothetical protein DIPPA_04038 [Diplonema papillatum]